MLPLFVGCLELSVIAVPIFFLIKIHLRFSRRLALANNCSRVLNLPHKGRELLSVCAIELKCVTRRDRARRCVNTFGSIASLSVGLLLLWIA